MTLDERQAVPTLVHRPGRPGSIRSLGRIPGAAAVQALRDLPGHEDRALRPRDQRVLGRRATSSAELE